MPQGSLGRSPTIESTPLISNTMQIVLPPEAEALIQRQLTSGKYNSAIDVILAAIKLLEQQQDIYQGRLPELQQDALIGHQASQRGEVVDGATAMAQIRANLRSRDRQ
ncbi:type II toxin-antitoxin system ParD family antitoxin [Microcoleus sp. N9_B4]|uniref:type II toxin-antitoxin system ParD family antitoxin n=1 Tax=Microcoleus sp. N9_B4 TaxID=3055386 RepID=UPI002FD10B6A